MLAADIVEIDIDALRHGRAHRIEQIAAGAIVDGMINSACPQPVTFGIRTRRGDNGAALDLGNLRDDRADCPGTAGNENRFAFLGLADFEQTGIAREARHAEHAEECLIRHIGLTRQLFERRRRRHERLAPAEER